MSLKEFLLDFFFKKVPTNRGEADSSCSCSNNRCSGSSDIEGVTGDLPPIARMRPGGVYKITNYGLDMEDIDISVSRRNMYSEDNFCWFELQGDASNGKQVFLEIDMDDDVILDVSINRDLKLNELHLSKTDLYRMKEQRQGRINYMDLLFEFDTSGTATFYRDAELDYGRDFSYVDFYNNEKKLTISVRLYEDSSEKIILSQNLRSDQIGVLSEGK